MKLVRSIAFSLSVAGVSVFAVACGGTVESPQTSASAATKAPIGTNTHGVVRLVGDALGEVPLRPEQRAEIEKLAAEAEARHAPMGDAKKELMTAFAAQIESGTLDRAALQPKIDKVTADFEKVRADDRAALTKLHGLLDAEQRGAFVDALEKQMKAKRGERGEHMKGGFGKLKALADDLQLTDEQRGQIRDAMREAYKEGREAHKDGANAGGWRHHARGERGPGHAEGKRGGPRHGGGPHAGKRSLEAFRADTFDLDQVAPPHDAKAMARFGVDRMSGFAEKILPILTPEQRKIAADKVRAMAAGGDATLLGH
ncbi:MAG: Spy/CpxP family protein refolding chaperone [Labilithrix sp.]|nr:Spy/CpxP family protein refolding chaperone [Labilithrix sp.]